MASSERRAQPQGGMRMPANNNPSGANQGGVPGGQDLLSGSEGFGAGGEPVAKCPGALVQGVEIAETLGGGAVTSIPHSLRAAC